MIFDNGFTSTATLYPVSTRLRPSVSTSVDFPAPGGPDNPTLMVGRSFPRCCCLFLCERICESSHCACLCFRGCLDSTAENEGGEGGGEWYCAGLELCVFGYDDSDKQFGPLEPLIFLWLANCGTVPPKMASPCIVVSSQTPPIPWGEGGVSE